ncbi:MAG: SAM-dependent methyltransferase [Candidatus Omnitrophica bacterium]|nr:SAM-dependent methyltransferase [Candidatus Omnitrophota bacterium]
MNLKGFILRLLGLYKSKPECFAEMRLTRYLSYKDIEAWMIDSKKTPCGKTLCISGTPPYLHKYSKQIQLVETAYPSIDIHHLPYPDQSFDWVVSDQVLEHVADPKKASEECWRVLKPGGIAIHSTVGFCQDHKDPKDHWRFMPDGLRELCKKYSKIHRCHHWGSPRAIRYLLDHPELWKDPNSYVDNNPSLMEMACDSDPIWPITLWIIAEK